MILSYPDLDFDIAVSQKLTIVKYEVRRVSERDFSSFSTVLSPHRQFTANIYISSLFIVFTLDILIEILVCLLQKM